MRIKGLDILRGLAIIFVLFRHSELEHNLIKDFGWLGVDLFFVLSGFLVSGLIFKEYLRTGSSNIKRFLIRRGFKIYPPFYIFLLVAIVIRLIERGTFYHVNHFLSEVFYMQSYFQRIFNHTWSLAVEEHFYIGFAIIVFIALKLKMLTNKKAVIISLIALLLTTFAMRFYVSYPHRGESFGFDQTHLRADGIIIGVLISYLYYFTGFFSWFVRHRWLFFFVAVGLVIPGFVYKGAGFFMNTYGLSMVNLGFGIFTLLSLLYTQKTTNLLLRLISHPINLLCYIGVHSYSIYLWHLLPVPYIEKLELNSVPASILMITSALVLGIVLSLLIERPFLKIRDRLIK